MLELQTIMVQILPPIDSPNYLLYKTTSGTTNRTTFAAAML